MKWKNAWKHKPPIGKPVLVYIPPMCPSLKEGSVDIAIVRHQNRGSKTIWWSYGNTVMWQPLPKPPRMR